MLNQVIILINDQNVAKLCDLGLATSPNPEEALLTGEDSDMLPGTYFYMSPELLYSVNSKQLWSNLKGYGISAKPKPSPFTFFQSEDICQHFASISSTHPEVDFTFSNILQLNNDFPYPEFELTEFTCDEIKQAISNIKSTACGIVGISDQHLGLMDDFGVQSVTDIFNNCINQKIFPTIWKKTLILPLTKTNSPAELSDLRPIALICALGKVFEKLIFKQLNKYINDNSLISSNQFGYRSGYGTDACLLKLISDINSAIDKQMVTISVLFDLSKAFDNVNHAILLEKLKHKNFSNNFLKLLNSYLSNRLIAVTDGSNQLSSWNRVTCGVPQGSILGPLLFILYADDLHSNMKYSTSMSYVDDTQIYLHCHPSDIYRGLKKIESGVVFSNFFVLYRLFVVHH